MLELSRHIARHPMRCPVQTRAIEGAFAAERLEGVKQAFESYRPYWQDLEREYAEAGDNYRSALEPEMQLARTIMEGLFRAYEGPVTAEHISIDLERNAA
ncbi:hypothetical protein [Hyphomonas sp.]|uniref:hypothetical protein n=1 Tax=Hyphomonas sp. TaxID=87 RepID=UPI0030022885